MDSVNWPDWVSASFAGLAVILSQFSPVKTWFKRRKIVVEIDRRVMLSQVFGVPGLQTYLSLRNIGARAERIRSISFIIDSEGGQFELVVEAIFQAVDSPAPVTFFPANIPAGSEWGHLVNATTQLDMSSEKTLSSLRAKVVSAVLAYQRAELDRKTRNGALVAAGLPPPVPSPPLHGDPSLKQAHEEFDRRKRWVAGEFKVQVQVTTDDRTYTSQRHRFTVFETQENELRGQIDLYVLGIGLMPGQSPSPVVCRVTNEA